VDLLEEAKVTEKRAVSIFNTEDGDSQSKRCHNPKERHQNGLIKFKKDISTCKV
jgi:hypothetical protein